MSDAKELAPCGLYCGICADKLLGSECHGCGCACGQCAGKYHAEHCAISRCTAEKGFRTCAECAELPCTQLIQFAYDPVWRTHLPVLENLRRVQRIGAEKWLEEQHAYWADPKRRARWLRLYQECGERHQAWEKESAD